MTNEEAIKILYNIRAYYASLTAGYPAHDCYGLGDMKCSDICKALLRGIRLLKQEPILDKIRAEIMDFEEELFHRPNTDYADYAAVRHCVEIIDKYKAESEEVEE